MLLVDEHLPPRGSPGGQCQCQTQRKIEHGSIGAKDISGNDRRRTETTETVYCAFPGLCEIVESCPLVTNSSDSWLLVLMIQNLTLRDGMHRTRGHGDISTQVVGDQLETVGSIATCAAGHRCREIRLCTSNCALIGRAIGESQPAVYHLLCLGCRERSEEQREWKKQATNNGL